LDLIVNLLSDLRLHCLQVIFQTIVDKVNQLHFVEDWVQETTDEFGSITKLPESFLSIVTNSVHLVKEVLAPANEREEVILSSEKSAEDFQQLIQNVMSSFAFTLENTAIEEHDSVSSVCPSESLKLIICMNNCRYSSSEVLPKIRNSFQEIFNIDLSSSFDGAMSQYQILVQKLLEAYIELKCDPIVAVIEPCMYAGKFDWARCPKPKDARDYIKGIVHNFIAVYGELERTSSNKGTKSEETQLTQIMESVAEVIAEEINRLFCCISRMNSNGCIQAWVDINCLTYALHPYLNKTAKEYLSEASKPLLDLERPGDREIVNACEKAFRSTMAFHLNAFERSKDLYLRS